MTHDIDMVSEMGIGVMAVLSAAALYTAPSDIRVGVVVVAYILLYVVYAIMMVVRCQQLKALAAQLDAKLIAVEERGVQSAALNYAINRSVLGEAVRCFIGVAPAVLAVVAGYYGYSVAAVALLGLTVLCLGLQSYVRALGRDVWILVYTDITWED